MRQSILVNKKPLFFPQNRLSLLSILQNQYFEFTESIENSLNSSINSSIKAYLLVNIQKRGYQFVNVLIFGDKVKFYSLSDFQDFVEIAKESGYSVPEFDDTKFNELLNNWASLEKSLSANTEDIPQNQQASSCHNRPHSGDTQTIQFPESFPKNQEFWSEEKL